MRPTYDDLSSLQSGVENPQGLRFVEFPIYSAIVGALNKYLPFASITVYGRLTSIFFSLLLIGTLYYLALKEHSRAAAIFSAGTYAVMPFFVFFSRVVLPETTAVSFMFLSIFFLYIDLNSKQTRISILYFVISVLCYAAAILVKPTAIFYSIAIGYLFVATYKFSVFKQWRPYLFVILGIVPFVMWRMYIQQFPEGIPGSTWLFKYVNTFEGPKDIFFTPAYFRWIYMERIGIAALGIYLSFFFLMGLTGSFKKYFLHSLFFSSLVYLLTFQGGNVQHEYYQTIALPGIALMIGLGAAHLVTSSDKVFSKFMAYPLLVLVFAISFSFSYYRVKDYYYVPADLPPIAKLIMTFTKPTDKIVTDRLGDTTLLYLADRKGAPAVYKEFPELKALGYTYLVTANKETTEKLKLEGKEMLVESNQFAIIKL